MKTMEVIKDAWLEIQLLWAKVSFYVARFIHRPIQGPITLDILYARLAMRKARLNRMIELQAPEFLLKREQELVQQALHDIKIRHLLIQKIHSKCPY